MILVQGQVDVSDRVTQVHTELPKEDRGFSHRKRIRIRTIICISSGKTKTQNTQTKESKQKTTKTTTKTPQPTKTPQHKTKTTLIKLPWITGLLLITEKSDCV